MLSSEILSSCRQIEIPKNGNINELTEFMRGLHHVDNRVNEVYESLCDTQLLKSADRDREFKSLSTSITKRSIEGSELTREEGERWKRSMSGAARSVYRRRKKHLERAFAYPALVKIIGPSHRHVVKDCLLCFNSNPNINYKNCTLWDYLAVYKRPSLLPIKIPRKTRKLLYSVAWSLKNKISRLRSAAMAIVFFNSCKRSVRTRHFQMRVVSESNSITESISTSVGEELIASSIVSVDPTQSDQLQESIISEQYHPHDTSTQSDIVSVIPTENSNMSWSASPKRYVTRTPPRTSENIQTLSALVTKNDLVASQIFSAVESILNVNQEGESEPSSEIKTALRQATSVAKETIHYTDRLSKMRDLVEIENKLRKAGVALSSSSASSDRLSDDTTMRIRKASKKKRKIKVTIKSPTISPMSSTDSTESNVKVNEESDRSTSTTATSTSRSSSSSPSGARPVYESGDLSRGSSDLISEESTSVSVSENDILENQSDIPVIDSGFTGPRKYYKIINKVDSSSSSDSESKLPVADRRIGRKTLIKKTFREDKKISQFTKKVKAGWDIPWRTTIRSGLSTDDEMDHFRERTQRKPSQTIKVNIDENWKTKLKDTQDISRYRQSIMSTNTAGTEHGGTSPLFTIDTKNLSPEGVLIPFISFKSTSDCSQDTEPGSPSVTSSTLCEKNINNTLGERRKLSLEKKPFPLMDIHNANRNTEEEMSSTNSLIKTSKFPDYDDSDVDRVEFASQSTVQSPATRRLSSSLEEKVLSHVTCPANHLQRYNSDEETSTNSPFSVTADICYAEPVIVFLLTSDIIVTSVLCLLSTSAATAPDFMFDVLTLELIRKSFVSEQRHILQTLTEVYDDDNETRELKHDEYGSSSLDSGSTVGFDPNGLLEDKLINFCCSSSIDISDYNSDSDEEQPSSESDTTSTSTSFSTSTVSINSTREWASEVQRRNFIWSDGGQSSSIVPTPFQLNQMTGSTTTDCTDSDDAFLSLNFYHLSYQIVK